MSSKTVAKKPSRGIREAIKKGSRHKAPSAASEIPAENMLDLPDEDPVPDRAIEQALEHSVSSDPLKLYLKEIQRYSLLEPEEEYALAIQLRDHGDTQSARRLVTANLRLVVKIAFEYRSIYANLLDLIQEGNVGLMKAVSRYDPDKGAKLSYYASWWIRSYILKYLLDNFRLVRIGTTQAQKKLFYHLMREKERLESQGIAAGPKLLASRLDVREKDVVEMQQRLSSSGSDLSLDAPIQGLGSDSGEGRSRSHMETLVDGNELPDSRLERDQLIRMIGEALPQLESTLNDKERVVLKERILSEEPKTLQEVADRYQLTRERVRQIESKVVEKLKHLLKFGS